MCLLAVWLWAFYYCSAALALPSCHCSAMMFRFNAVLFPWIKTKLCMVPSSTKNCRKSNMLPRTPLLFNALASTTYEGRNVEPAEGECCAARTARKERLHAGKPGTCLCFPQCLRQMPHENAQRKNSNTKTQKCKTGKPTLNQP